MNIDNIVRCFRPLKFVFFQSFHKKTEAVPIPVQNLDDIAFAVTEGKDVAGKRIKVKLIGDQDRKTVDGFAHIGNPSGDIDFHLVGWSKHQRLSRVASSLDNVDAEKSSLTSTATALGRMTLSEYRADGTELILRFEDSATGTRAVSLPAGLFSFFNQ
jgi:hypothetical protein